MKSKILTAALLGMAALPCFGVPQTNPAAMNQTLMEAAPTNPPATIADIDTNATVVVTNETIVETNTIVAVTNKTVAVLTNATILSRLTNSSNISSTNPPSAAFIPLIQFQDVPITTAIENLARQAGINYLIDPKIGYGQPDKNGQIKAEPVLSVRWEKLTARQALLALLDNYGLQLDEDPDTHVSRITLKDLAALPPLEMRVIQLQYASVSNMVETVSSALTDSRSRVVPDMRTSQLVIVATEKEQTNMLELVKDLDTPTRQVLIETKLVEISSNPSTSKGIDWSGTLGGQNISFGNGVLNSASSQTITTIPGTATTTTLPGGRTVTGTSGSSSSTTLTIVPQSSSSGGGLSLNTANGFDPGIGFLNADGVHAVLSFLNQSSDAQVVSTPRVVTLDNQTATISVTRAFPIIQVTASTAGVSSGSSSITYSNVGTVLQVTPRISANDNIWLRVVPDVSSFFATITKQIAGFPYQADEFDTRHIDTQVLIPNAHTLVMGGMVKDNPTASYTKVPFLGDIPILGYAFRSENKSMDKDNLLIFITPTILKDADFHPTETAFLKTPIPVLKSPMNPHNVWDSAQPAGDWSDPLPIPGEFGDTQTNSFESANSSAPGTTNTPASNASVSPNSSSTDAADYIKYRSWQ